MGSVVALLGVVALLRVPAALATDPRDPVEELVAVLEAGDMEEVLELGGFEEYHQQDFLNVLPAEPEGLFSPETIAEGWELPSIEIGTTGEVGSLPGSGLREELEGRPPGARRTVLHFGDIWTADMLTVRQETGWIRDWELVTGYPISRLTGEVVLPHDPLGPVTIGGMTFEPTDHQRSVGRNYADALVGVYQVTYEHPMFEPATETVAVRSDEETRLTLPVGDVRKEVAEAATEQIQGHVRTCVEESTELRPAGCIIGHDPGHYFPLRGEASWELQSMPELEFTPMEPDEHFGHPRIVVSTVSPGEASVTYSFVQEPERTESVEVEVGGFVELGVDGAPVWKL